MKPTISNINIKFGKDLRAMQSLCKFYKDRYTEDYAHYKYFEVLHRLYDFTEDEELAKENLSKLTAEFYPDFDKLVLKAGIRKGR